MSKFHSSAQTTSYSCLLLQSSSRVTLYSCMPILSTYPLLLLWGSDNALTEEQSIVLVEFEVHGRILLGSLEEELQQAIRQHPTQLPGTYQPKHGHQSRGGGIYIYIYIYIYTPHSEGACHTENYHLHVIHCEVIFIHPFVRLLAFI